MLRIGKYLILLTFALGLCACSAGEAGTTVTEKDAGETITLAVGDVLTVNLEGNITTGYNWELENTDLQILELAEEPSYAPENEMPGSPGVITLRFNAVAAGEEILKLVYRRSWETDVDPLETFAIIVEVK
ncbi:MAG: protease inhibitor I42 family protein [Anaerolineaceae bacterium]|nr:protease inhibitor I42 family protein [Anaerolineaceae bacterium]